MSKLGGLWVCLICLRPEIPNKDLQKYELVIPWPKLYRRRLIILNGR